MPLRFLLDRMEAAREIEVLGWRGQTVTCGELLDLIEDWRVRLDDDGVARGDVVAIAGDYSPETISLTLALIARSCTVAPLLPCPEERRARLLGIAQAQFLFAEDGDGNFQAQRLTDGPSHDLLLQLRDTGHPGLIIFTSGSTGERKAVVHEVTRLLSKFKVVRAPHRSMAFLLFDHIGGINTLLHQLATIGFTALLPDRSPDTVLSAVERYALDTLPVTPTFLTMMILSGAIERHRLDSLKRISYGTEPMPVSTLAELHRRFPRVKLLQLYGLTETSILRTRSEASDSLWIDLAGEGFETRVVDGALEIRGESTMLGYLNAPSPFTDDGWLRTGDRVEVDGSKIKILGRGSETINVGGEKVHPAEVESVIRELSNVAHVTVHGASNPVTGQAVCARVALVEPEPERDFAKRLRRQCADRLDRYQIPVKVAVISVGLDEITNSESSRP